MARLTRAQQQERTGAAILAAARAEFAEYGYAEAKIDRIAEPAELTRGAAALAEDAPGSGDPFDLARAVEHLAGIALSADEEPPHLSFVDAARPARDDWTVPRGLRNEVTGRWIDLAEDGVVVVLGAGRL